MAKSATLKHRGIKLVPVKVMRCPQCGKRVVERNGKFVCTKCTWTIKAWIDGYMKALSLFTKENGQ